MPDAARRLDHLDALRGLAIVTMVGANMASLLLEPHPLPFRYFGSFAAPTFVTLSGFFVAFTAAKGRENFRHFLARSALLLATAALIDIVCYGLMPFVQVDVLYLIGAGTPLAYLVARLRKIQVAALAIAAFALAPVLRSSLGYSPKTIDLMISGKYYGNVPENAAIWKHWIVDGWFPLFPWLGFLFLGVLLAKQLADRPDWLRTHVARRLGLLLALAGAILMRIAPSPMYVRDGYSEIFYPPVTGFLLLAVGVFLLAGWLTAISASHSAWKYARGLGRASLCFYLVHLLVISFVLKSRFEPMALIPFLALYFVFLTSLVFLSQNLANWKKTQPWLRSYLGKFYFGT